MASATARNAAWCQLVSEAITYDTATSASQRACSVRHHRTRAKHAIGIHPAARIGRCDVLTIGPYQYGAAANATPAIAAALRRPVSSYPKRNAAKAPKAIATMKA